MRKLNKNEWTLVTICVVVLFLMFAEGALRKYRTLKSQLENRISLQERELGNLIVLLETQDRFHSEYQKKIVKSEKIKDSNDFIRQVQDIARQSGFDIRDIQPAEKKERDHATEYTVGIETESSVAGLVAFLNACSNALRGVTFDSLSIERQGANRFPKIRAQLRTIVFSE